MLRNLTLSPTIEVSKNKQKSVADYGYAFL